MTLNNSPVYNNGQGGIVNDGGTVTLNNSPVSGNTASSEGGGINNAGTVTLNKSPVSGNTPDQCSPVLC